jgi:hypothetical protein
VLEVESGLQVPNFRNSTYLDPQVGIARDLGVHHKTSKLESRNSQNWDSCDFGGP